MVMTQSRLQHRKDGYSDIAQQVNVRSLGPNPSRFTYFFVFPLALRSGGFVEMMKLVYIDGLSPSAVKHAGSSPALDTIYIMYAGTLLYIYIYLQFIKKKQYNCKDVWRVSTLSTPYLSFGVLHCYYTHLGPQKIGAKILQFFSFAKMHLVLGFWARYSFVILCMTRISKKSLIVLLSILFEDLKILRYGKEKHNYFPCSGQGMV